MSSSNFLTSGGAKQGSRFQSRGFTSFGTAPPQANSLIPSNLSNNAVPLNSPGQNITGMMKSITLQDTPSSESLTPKEQRDRFYRIRQSTSNLPRGEVVGLTWQMLDDDQIIEKSGGNNGVVITEANSSRARGSVNDPRMGPTIDEICVTCGENYINCFGHPGRIRIPYIINPAAYKQLGWVLKSICWDCGRLLINEEELNRKGVLKLTGYTRLRLIAKLSDGKKCIALATGTDISCTSASRKVDSKHLKAKGQIRYQFKSSSKSSDSEDLELDVNDDSDDKSLRKILMSIDRKTLDILGFGQNGSPLSYVVENWLVQPPCVRQPAYVDGIKRDDQLTGQYINIVKYSRILLKTNKQTNKVAYDAAYDNLVRAINILVNGQEATSRFPNGNTRGIKQRLVGKYGMMRQDIQGSSVGQVMRSVASGVPAGDLPHGWVFMPFEYMKIMNTSIWIDSNNRDVNQAKLENGLVTYIEPGSGKYAGRRRKVTDNIKETYKLRISDRIFRFIEDGDVAIINRQPTLHRHGIFGVFVKGWSNKTIGIPHSMLEGLNVDFDGDEVNLHVPIEYDAIIEARTIAHSFNCLLTRSNNAAFGVIQDVIIGAHLLSDPKGSVDVDTFHDMLTMIDGPQLASLERRANEFELPSRVPGQDDRVPATYVFSALLPEGFYYTKGDVLIINGILVKGRITKAHVGTSDNTIIKELDIAYPDDFYLAYRFINELSKIANRYLLDKGISLGLSDCLMLTQEDQLTIEKELIQAVSDIQELSYKITKRTNPYEKLRIENMIKARGQAVRAFGVKLTKQRMTEDNNLKIIVESGSKGGYDNIAQISAALGPVLVEGKIPPVLYPFFSDDDQKALARGMVFGSYGGRPVYDIMNDGSRRYTGRIAGIDVPAVVFQAAAARDGLANTSVKTKIVGQMSRLLRRVMEDIISKDDGTVRYGDRKIIQYSNVFNSSRLFKISVGNTTKGSFVNFRNTIGRLNAKYGYASNYNNSPGQRSFTRITPSVTNDEIEMIMDEQDI